MTRTCKYVKCGGPIPVTARADADFCRPEHKSAHHNEQRRSQGTPTKRLDPASGGEGSRGGNVRTLDEAREVQATVKAKRDWSGAIDEQIRDTLISTGYFHADDLDALGVPPEHCNLKGTRTASFRNRKLMEKTGAERKVSHAAANGRKAPIYRITARGRSELAKQASVGLDGEEKAGEIVSSPAPSGSSVQSGETGVGVLNAQATGRDQPSALPSAGTGKPEPLSLLPEPDPEAWAA